MGMSTCLYGFKPADAKWKQMKGIRDVCVAAKVEIPREVRDFFEGQDPPDPDGVQAFCIGCYDNRDIDGRVNASSIGVESLGGEVGGFTVDLRKLPADVKILRFENSF